MAALLGAALAVAGCQDGYPIPATRCDHWCDLRQETQCGNYNPASCVVECERVSRGAACYGPFDDLLRCLREHQQELVCDNSGSGLTPTCEVEQTSMAACSLPHAPPWSE